MGSIYYNKPVTPDTIPPKSDSTSDFGGTPAAQAPIGFADCRLIPSSAPPAAAQFRSIINRNKEDWYQHCKVIKSTVAIISHLTNYVNPVCKIYSNCCFYEK